jgi:hypothetical protein
VILVTANGDPELQIQFSGSSAPVQFASSGAYILMILGLEKNCLGFESLGFEGLGFEGLGFEGLGFEGLGFEGFGFEGLGF